MIGRQEWICYTEDTSKGKEVDGYDGFVHCDCFVIDG